jgi:hypothetical protein
VKYVAKVFCPELIGARHRREEDVNGKAQEAWAVFACSYRIIQGDEASFDAVYFGAGWYVQKAAPSGEKYCSLLWGLRKGRVVFENLVPKTLGLIVGLLVDEGSGGRRR